MHAIGAVLAALVAIQAVYADLYMHNPRGSNDRNCETNDDRNNGNRLFDSQNNARGGYACPRAWPFSCYTMPVEADREACNQWNADQTYDDISTLNMADMEGVLDPRGTRTPRMYYYEGSILQIEWTNQHGCGQNPLTHCDMIIQYACEDTLTDDCGEPDSGMKCGPRDGIPISNSNNNRGTATYQPYLPNQGTTAIDRQQRDTTATQTIPVSITYNVQSDPRFGRHETLEYYVKCAWRERNMGLFLADQNLAGNTAIFTRQNAGGTRQGYECQEERDYYPYWGPTPWKDIAILTDQIQNCPWLVSQSQNTLDHYECVCPTCISQNTVVPNNRGGCTSVGGTWVLVPKFNINPPVCGPAPTTRQNNLGNPIGGGKSGSSFNWTIPYNVPAGNYCILRLRYNISTGDPIPNTNLDVDVYGTSAQNQGNSPLKDRQNSEVASYKSFVELPTEQFPAAKLGMEMNTNQYGRTFQDRSYTFQIRKAAPTGECGGKQIYNLNMRGKRGNIVEVYPAVEYDFVPNEFYLTELDCLHIQWTGSDYNPARDANDGFGGPPDPNDMNTGRADRSNLVQIAGVNYNQVVASLDSNYNMFVTSRERKVLLPFIGQPITDTNTCMTIDALVALSAQAQSDPTNPMYTDNGQSFLQDSNDRDRYFKNCGKLSNAKTPYFDGGLFVPNPTPGDYYFMNTRDSSFSNRNVIGIMHVQSSLIASGSVIFVVLGGAVGMALAAAGVVTYRRRSHRAMMGDYAIQGAPGTGLIALLPFGRRNSPHQINGTAEPAAPIVPSRTRPGALSATAPLAAGAGAAKSGVTTVTALHNHQASEAGELEFRKGDIITVIRRDDSGWWEGSTPDGKKGIFPANYVRLNN